MSTRPLRTTLLVLAAASLLVVALMIALGWQLARLESPTTSEPTTSEPRASPADSNFETTAERRAGLPAKATSPRLLASGRELLGPGGRELGCGPYRLLTDVSDRELIESCGKLARSLDQVYRQRYGLDPVGDPAGTILLFAQRASFREMARRDGRVRAGYAGYSSGLQGIVVLTTEGPDRAEVLRTLAHELTHLVNRRALGRSLPPWLSEGLADGIGDSAVEDSATASGWAPHDGLRGIEGPARRLRDGYAAGQAQSLERLVALERSGFDRATRSYDYEQSALFVRYLLAEPKLAPRFRAYLRRLSVGQAYAPESLRETLGVSWQQLDRDFEGWLRAQS